ncbi:polysaccharide pyruvyl transferase family protein [Nocardioides sp. CN2-186]|uniref:polysaccharide pyruvyl transferase family protein n=1 Tax=Nocardioides tweenelious TaxID=3156607 RepID=UPI0032B31740
MATTRILLRAGKDPFQPLSAEETLARNVLGDNGGNALFSGAIHQLLSRADTEVVADHWSTQKPADQRMTVRDIAAINEEYDAFVLPMANAFRRGFTRNLRALTRVIERLTIPVVVVGAGAQLPMDGPFVQPDDEPDRHIVRFLRAVLDRSPAIGVRGEKTRAYLGSLGFGDEHVDVVGCPSLSAHTGPEVVKRVDSLDRSSRLALNLTPVVPGIGALVEHHVDAYDDLVYIAQTNATLGLLLGQGDDRAAELDPRLPHSVDHPLFRAGQVRFYVDPTPWIDYLATRDFAFGTRLHGNVAALEAGTPAVLLSIDSRTQELADYHQIPHRRLTHDLFETADAAELYAEADFTAFNARRTEIRDHLLAFLHRAGLETQDEADAAAYRQRLAATQFAPAVVSGSSPER